MRQSRLFTKTLRQAPKDEETKNAQLLVRAGFVDKLMAGVYSYLPLGLRTLKKIEGVVREEMNAVGAEEILMPMLHPKHIWAATGGWDSIDVLFKIKSRTEKEYALGQSEEEVVSPLMARFISTYRDFPAAVYQVNWKFRDELRAKSGLLRGREFLMKDMYSFHESQDDFESFYARVKQAYLRIHDRMGLVAKATEASGGSFSKKISYEFMVLTDAGEDDIFFCDACDFCINAEIAPQKEGDMCPKCAKGPLLRATASEVGNVFDLGDKYTKDFAIEFVGRDGGRHHPVMGCYGIGISRLMGVIAEKYNDEHGLIWPESVAPFRVHLIGFGLEDQAVREKADSIYEELQKRNIEVLYDDHLYKSAGEKLADADLIGIPYRAIISVRNLEKNMIEVKKRDSSEARLVSQESFFQELQV